MYDLEKAIQAWKKAMYQNPALDDGIIEELEVHLREELTLAMENGLEAEAAFRRASAEVGMADVVGDEYFKMNTRVISGTHPRRRHPLSPALLFHYAKISIRKMKRRKGYSLINMAGLAIGMACCILIFLWMADELSFDRFHENADRIVRVVATDLRGGEARRYLDTPSLLGPTLKDEYPEVIDFCRMQCGWTNYWLHYGDKKFFEKRLCTADPSFFKIFRFPFIYGNAETALSDRSSIVLTQSLAQACFGNENPLGRVMMINNVDLTVTGVVEDIPDNSHLQFDYVFPAENMTEFRSSRFDTWEYAQFATYLELKEGTDVAEFEEKIHSIITEHLPQVKAEISLQRLKDIHLHTTGIETWTVVYTNPGNFTTVSIFGLVAFCILMLACINFMNLMTARSSLRASEVGLRKVAGARRKDLIQQFYGEAVLTTLISMAVALSLVQLFLPSFNQLTGKNIDLINIELPMLLLGLLGITMLTGIMAGSYPALFLSSLQPTIAIKDITRSGLRRSGFLRRLLVVFQFALTTVLLILTAVVYTQLHFIQNKSLGFDSGNIIAVFGRFGRDYEVVRRELLQNPDIQNVCLAALPSQGFGRTTDVDWDGRDPEVEYIFDADTGDYDFLDTFGMTMAEGRYYSREFSTDRDNFVINETAARLMGPGSAVGRRFHFNDRDGTIIGVVRDYHGASLHEPITPKVMVLREGHYLCVRFSGEIQPMVRYLEKKWKESVPIYPFRYEFVEEKISAYYKTERTMSLITRNLTFLAVFVACLGLLGLAAFTTEQKTKEIGIRKVLGARVASLTGMMVKDFAKWVLAANLIAWPLAYYLSMKWLSSFAYRTDLNWRIFILTMATTVIVALCSVGFQAVRAAAADPVSSLRYE